MSGDFFSLLAYKGALRVVGQCRCGMRHNPANVEAHQATLEDIADYLDRKELWEKIAELAALRFEEEDGRDKNQR